MQRRVDFQTKCLFSTIKFSKSPINALWKYWNIFICYEIEGISTAIFLASFWYLITLSKESTKSLSLPPIKTSFILIINMQSNGWIQTLFREIVSQSLGHRTFNSESASKIMPACDIWVLKFMCKCLFFQKTFSFVLMGKLPQKWTNLKTFWI